MRAVFTNFGTRGDFQPLLILAEELAQHGHHPVFVAPSFAESTVREYEFEFISVGPDLSGIRDKVNVEWVEHAEKYESPEAMFNLLAPFQQYFPEIFNQLSQNCRGADVLISGPAQPLSRMVHDLTGIAFVSVQMAHFGGSGGEAIREAGDRLVNPVRRQFGLGPIKDPLTAGANSPHLALYAMSRHFLPRPLDWPSHYHLTGFFFAKEDSTIDANLENFIKAGSPPVVITFGSMIHADESRLERLLLDAVRLSGCRAVLQSQYSSGQGEGEDDLVYRVGFVSHSALFPRAAAVVFHGGAGTAAAVFRAGVPGIFVPHGDRYDQRYWAQLANEMGCAPESIPFLELTPASLAAAMRNTVSNPDYRTRAGELAAKIQAEQGVRTARQLIESLVTEIGLDDPEDDCRLMQQTGRAGAGRKTSVHR